MADLLMGVGLALCTASLVGLGFVAWRRVRAATRAAEAHEAVPPRAAAPRSAAWATPRVVLREVNDGDIEAQIRTGAMASAVLLYREKTGASPDEARSAVEAWRNRLRAS